jgi:hypothetical protein
VEEPTNFGNLEDTWTKSNLDYIVDLSKPTCAIEKKLVHFGKARVPLCLQNFCSSHICLQGKQATKNH